MKIEVRQKKGYSSDGKRFRLNFSRIIDFGKPQGTIYKGPQGIPTFILKVFKKIIL